MSLLEIKTKAPPTITEKEAPPTMLMQPPAEGQQMGGVIIPPKPPVQPPMPPPHKRRVVFSADQPRLRVKAFSVKMRLAHDARSRTSLLVRLNMRARHGVRR